MVVDSEVEWFIERSLEVKRPAYRKLQQVVHQNKRQKRDANRHIYCCVLQYLCAQGWSKANRLGKAVSAKVCGQSTQQLREPRHVESFH